MTDEKNTLPTSEPAAEVPFAADADGAPTPEDHPFTPPATSADAPDSERATDPGSDPGSDPDVALDSVSDAFAAMTDGPDGVDAAAPVQYGLGPFSIREVALGGVWLVAFVVSFFPVYHGSGSVWSSGIDWVLTIGAPTIAVFLLALRRLSPQGIRRVGSLGIDQFASVTFTVSALIWLGILWSSFVTLFDQRLFYGTWVIWVEFIVMLAGVLLTVFAPLFPTIGEDFRHRPEVPAHRFASPARPVVARPRTPRPAPAEVPAATASAPPADGTDAIVDPGERDDLAAASLSETTVIDTAEVADAAPSASQAFWALAPEERPIVDDAGATLFHIGPTAWALVIDDLGDRFVVRHEDGRIGYLTDVSGVMRG